MILEFSDSENSSESEDKNEQLIFNDYMEPKIIGGLNINADITFNSKAKNVQIIGGKHFIRIKNNIENLLIMAGENEVHIKSPIENLNILGGKSTIYIHNINDTKVNILHIKGGEHKIDIFSYVHKLEIYGGVNIIKCNYINSKLDKIITIGGTRNIYLNQATNKCIKNVKGGVIDFHTTNPKEPPVNILYKDATGVISPTIYNNTKKDGTCSICVDNFLKNYKVLILPCFHIFHVDCLKAWFKGKKPKLCPNCKFEVKNKILYE